LSAAETAVGQWLHAVARKDPLETFMKHFFRSLRTRVLFSLILVPLLNLIVGFVPVAHAQDSTPQIASAAQTKRVSPRLTAEISELGDQAVLSNIVFQTTPAGQRSLVLGIGFSVLDTPIATKAAANSVCKRFGYNTADSADWDDVGVFGDEVYYIADPGTLKPKLTYGKDLPKSEAGRRLKHLSSVICRA
jgi:hypothetical protein